MFLNNGIPLISDKKKKMEKHERNYWKKGNGFYYE